MKFLWSTSFRSFGRSVNNDILQKNFLNSLKSLNLDITLFVTQFGEEEVESQLKEQSIKYIYKDAKDKIPANKKYSNKYMLKYSLEEFLSSHYDYYVHSTVDLILPFNIKESLLKFKNKTNTLFFVFPNTLFVNGKLINPNSPLFGIDIFIYKIDKEMAKSMLYLVEDWEQYDWGIVDNFLISISEKIKLDFVNLYKTSNIIKFENDFYSFGENSSSQKLSWIENNNNYLKFLKKNGINSLYAKGSYYFLALQFFRIKDLNLMLFICYLKLFFNFFLYSLKKILSIK
ncbi:hypothetical protein MCEGEM12_00231 [Candidatus Pelagibacterales bacterium]